MDFGNILSHDMKATEENVPFLDKYQYKDDAPQFNKLISILIVCVFVYLLLILWRIALSLYLYYATEKMIRKGSDLSDRLYFSQLM